MKNYCNDCGKKLDRKKPKRCRSCHYSNLARNLKPKKRYYCCDCKKEIDYYKSKRCRACYVKNRVAWNKGMSKEELLKHYKNGKWPSEGIKVPENQREKHYNWKGGKIIQNGYIYVLCPDHPKAKSKKGYVAEHVLVMEKKIRRYLQGEECIHHIDEDKQNNKINNLILFNNNAEHRIACHNGCKHTKETKEKMRKISLIREAKKRKERLKK